MTDVANLSVESLSGGYGAIQILRQVSLEVAAGRVTALVGSNGAGKTTLMRHLAGLLPARGGTLRFAGEAITGLACDERVARGLVLVPEGRLVFPQMTVEENLLVGAFTAHARARRRDGVAETYRLFPRLRERRRQAAATLSGGEQQMLALGRGLMARPRLLLLDEPTLGLAPAMAREIFEFVEGLVAGGLTVLLAEQDVPKALALADQAYVLENGRIVDSGSAAALRDKPKIKAAYLGLTPDS